MGKTKVLIVAASERPCEFLSLRQQIEQLGVTAEVSYRQAIETSQAATWDVVCLEHHETAEATWRDDVVTLRRMRPSAPIILLARHGSEALAVDALRWGLGDYVSEPWSKEAIAGAIQRCLSKESVSDGASENSRATGPAGRLILGSNLNIKRLRDYLVHVASADSTVLITGETGTGKELVAEFIHENSPRGSKPFICINCAAIPDPLLESELFGHTKGAFTGAEGLRDGLLAAADGGTVFLDEIGDMSLFAQAKILRVLENKEVYRLGGTRRTPLNVRFVAASNRDLQAMTATGTFRRDLYFRLNVVCVQLPPLRERRDDIPLLVEDYCRRQCERLGFSPPAFSQECLDCLLRYDWPGNIRELRNVLEALFLSEVPALFCAAHLPERIRALIGAHNDLSSSERELLVTALSSEHWNKSKAAAKLHWSRMTLYRKMAKYQITRFASREVANTTSSPQAPVAETV